MECNPMYFTSGSIIRNLVKIQKETGYSNEEMVKKYIFLGGGGQCGPCRYGMYPQEYLKVLNDAGYKNFRLLTFSSDIASVPRFPCYFSLAAKLPLSFFHTFTLLHFYTFVLCRCHTQNPIK